MAEESDFFLQVAVRAGTDEKTISDAFRGCPHVVRSNDLRDGGWEIVLKRNITDEEVSQAVDAIRAVNGVRSAVRYRFGRGAR